MKSKIKRRLLSVGIMIGGALIAMCGCVKPLGLHERVMRARKIEALLTEATGHLRRGADEDLDMAEAALRLGWELAPGDARISDGLGCVAWRRGNISSAESMFRQAVRKDPYYSRPYAHLALVAEKRGELELAEKLLKKAIMLNPLNYRARNNFAVLIRKNKHGMPGRRRSYDELLKAVHSAPEGEPILEYNRKRITETVPR